MAATIVSSVPLPIPHLSIRPYFLDGALGYYDNLYEGYGPFMTVRTTLSKHITSQDVGTFRGRRPFRGLICCLVGPFLKLSFAKVVLAAALSRACVLALFLDSLQSSVQCFLVFAGNQSECSTPSVRD